MNGTGQDDGREHLAPVIPIFGGSVDVGRPTAGAERGRPARAPAAPQLDETSPAARAAAALDHAERTVALRALNAAHARDARDDAREGMDDESVKLRERAEVALVRKLRSKALSVAESRAVLREHDLDRETIDEIIDEFSDRGYIDDPTLAELLVTSGAERKGQGRVALARVLSQRGIPRDIAEEALSELPDDDAERALEFARSKAPGMTRLESDTALRRLLGQLARRGYGGSVAMNAARTALREAGRGASGARSGVRFVDSE